MSRQNTLAPEPLVITDADVLDDMEQMMAEEALAHAPAACPPEALEWVNFADLTACQEGIRPCSIYCDAAATDWLLEFMETEAATTLGQVLAHLASDAIISATAPGTCAQLVFDGAHLDTVFMGGTAPHRCLVMLPREGEGLVPVYLHVVGLRYGKGGYHLRLGAIEGGIID